MLVPYAAAIFLPGIRPNRFATSRRGLVATVFVENSSYLHAMSPRTYSETLSLLSRDYLRRPPRCAAESPMIADRRLSFTAAYFITRPTAAGFSARKMPLK